MKFGLNLKTRLGACLLFMTALCALPLSSASVTVFGADAPETASESPKIIASVIVNSLEEAWNGSERIADAMQYKELLTGLRGLVRIQFESYIDLSKPIGAVIAVDGDDVAPFIFFSLTELSSPPDLKKEPFRTLNEKELNYLLDEDNLLLITPSKFNEVVSSFPKESCLPAPSAEGYDTIVTATINVDALPEELIESVAAVLRQQFAELVEDDEIIDLQSIDEALEKYSELVDAVEQLQWRLYVDPDANLVSEGTITVDPESSLAPSSEPALTRWNAIAETPDAIFASAGAGANPDELAVDVSENVRTAIHENLLEALYVEIDDILAPAREGGEMPFVLALDSLQDPQNVGSLMRTAEAVGVHGVILPDRRAVGVTPAVSRASAGAVEHLQVAMVKNLVRALDELKERGLWIAGGEDHPEAVDYTGVDLNRPLALVLGSEGRGMRRLVAERCDFLLRIPMRGRVGSLNVSVAGGILLYRAWHARQSP